MKYRHKLFYNVILYLHDPIGLTARLFTLYANFVLTFIFLFLIRLCTYLHFFFLKSKYILNIFYKAYVLL